MIGTAEHPALVAAARFGLEPPGSPISLEMGAGERVLAQARSDHITGLLAAAVIGGEIELDDDLAQRLVKQWHDELLICVRLEALAVRTGAILDAAGVTWRLTKGAALAHLDYPDSAARTFGDVDLIIHPSDWSEAFAALTTAAYRREATTLPGDYDDRYGKGATLTAPDGLEVDLHRRFAIGRFGVGARMEAVFSESETVELAGRSIPVLAPAGRLLHACFHAALGGFRRLRAFRDVAQLILVSGADWQDAFSVAQSWRSEAVIASAIRETWERLDLRTAHPAHARALSTPVSRGDRHALEVFGAGSPFRAQALTSLPRLPFHEVPRYLWSLLPSRRRR